VALLPAATSPSCTSSSKGRTDPRRSPLTQPFLGIAATALVLALSLLFIAIWPFERFNGWVAFFMMSFIPFEVVTAVIWGGTLPFAARLHQPMKGLALLLLTLGGGVLTSQVVYRTLGASQGEPGPMLAFFCICVIVTTFFLTIGFGGWPFTAVFRNSVAAGPATWVACYVVGFGVYWIFSDFAFLQGAPVYVASADPGGRFNAWDVVVVYMAALTILFAWLCFDLWPLTRVPALMRQPVLGLVLAGSSLVLGYALFYASVRIGDVQNVEFLLRVPVAFIFGTILVLNMLQNSLVPLPQPTKGVLNVALAAAVGSLLLVGFQLLQPIVSGPVPPGPPEFQREQFQVWTANALLAVTFPFLVFHAAYFNFWPLRRDA
jgi:hypothetical protein